jgi:hypothetical protein
MAQAAVTLQLAMRAAPAAQVQLHPAVLGLVLVPQAPYLQQRLRTATAVLVQALLAALRPLLPKLVRCLQHQVCTTALAQEPPGGCS